MFGFGFGATRRRRTGAAAPSITLGALGLSAAVLAENSAAGTVIGAITGRTAGSALTLTDDAGGRFAIAGSNLVAGLVATNFEAATAHAITVRETLAGASNSPRDTVTAITVTNLFEQPSLTALSLSAAALTIGSPTSGTITGTTAGSTIAASGLPAGLTVNGPARTWAWSGTGSAGPSSATLVETLADSANSPRTSTVSVTVNAAPATAPGYLATAATAPYAVWGAQRLISGFGGALFQLRRSSDGATMDVAAVSGGDYPDYPAITAWAGGAALTIPVVYDQSGNARHLAQATVASQPSFDLAQKTGNAVPILIDGQTQGVSTGGLVTKTPQLGSLSLDLVANSFFLAAAPVVTQGSTGYVEFTSEDGATVYQACHSAARLFALRNGGTNESTTDANVPRAMLDVFGASNSASASIIYANGTRRSTGHTRTAQAMARIRFGTSAAGGSSYNGRFKLFGFAAYAATVSTTDGDAVVASMKTASGYNAAFPYRVVFAGDSIMEGTGSLLLRNMPLQMALTKNAELFNMAIHGQTLATEYTGRVARFSTLFTASYPCVFFIEGGTNDIANATTGANLYANTTAPLIAYLKGLGFKAVAGTLLPRTGSTGWTAAMENERLAYNALVVANSAAADLVLDLAADPVMGATSAPADTAKYVDKVHPTSTGYGYLAPLYTAALQTVLRTTALGASYVP